MLLLDDMEGAGLATLREVAAAIGRFRASGKPVIAWGSSLDQRRYFLAAHADQVLLHPYGRVVLQGFGGYRNYYRDALDAVGVTVNVFKVGRYKSAAEPFVQNEPSEEARRDEAALLGDLWAQYQSAIESARRPAGRQPDEDDRRPAGEARRGRWRRGEAGAGREADRRPEDARRTARADDGEVPPTRGTRPSGRSRSARYLATLPPTAGD
ncbi:MAG: S49 family peptidase, partial [Comamonadaceae bacterium]|nr:S49 family peptidase [Comamonadaceae bacterium]